MISHLQVFSSIYGCGPATARKWYEKGYRSIADVLHAVSDGMKLTEQQTMGKWFAMHIVETFSVCNSNMELLISFNMAAKTMKY